MTGRPLVTVVVPVYNAQNYIRAAIDGALGQTYQPCEIIAVNDGSTDDSLRALQDFQGRIEIISQNNSGVSVARNRGASAGRGKYIAFLDSDDVWDSSKIERQVQMMESFPDAVMTYCDHRIIDGSGCVTGASGATQSLRVSGRILRVLLGANTIISPSLTLVRRDAFREAGGFDDALRVSEDYDLWLRLSLLGPILYQLETLASYRRHGENKYGGPDLKNALGKRAAIEKVMPLLTTSDRDSLSSVCLDSLLMATQDIAWQYRLNSCYTKAFLTHLQAIRLRPWAARLYVNALKSFLPRRGP